MSDNKTAVPDRDWSSYYKHKSNLIPRETLLKALDLFDTGKRNVQNIANDIGCGHGADTIELLKRGWKVNAFDSEPEGLLILSETVSEDWSDMLSVFNQKFENIELPECNLLNASFSLPFCLPDHFKELWNKIEKCIKINGRFAGNFFGENDEWSSNKDMSFHHKEDVAKLFSNFDIEYFHERDEDGATADGTPKHWHVFSVIARKIKN
jgi:SAM-dependent methyltransferase